MFDYSSLKYIVIQYEKFIQAQMNRKVYNVRYANKQFVCYDGQFKQIFIFYDKSEYSKINQKYLSNKSVEHLSQSPCFQQISEQKIKNPVMVLHIIAKLVKPDGQTGYVFCNSAGEQLYKTEEDLIKLILNWRQRHLDVRIVNAKETSGHISAIKGQLITQNIKESNSKTAQSAQTNAQASTGTTSQTIDKYSDLKWGTITNDQTRGLFYADVTDNRAFMETEVYQDLRNVYKGTKFEKQLNGSVTSVLVRYMQYLNHERTGNLFMNMYKANGYIDDRFNSDYVMFIQSIVDIGQDALAIINSKHRRQYVRILRQLSDNSQYSIIKSNKWRAHYKRFINQLELGSTRVSVNVTAFLKDQIEYRIRNDSYIRYKLQGMQSDIKKILQASETNWEPVVVLAFYIDYLAISQRPVKDTVEIVQTALRLDYMLRSQKYQKEIKYKLDQYKLMTSQILDNISDITKAITIERIRKTGDKQYLSKSIIMNEACGYGFTNLRWYHGEVVPGAGNRAYGNQWFRLQNYEVLKWARDTYKESENQIFDIDDTVGDRLWNIHLNDTDLYLKTAMRNEDINNADEIYFALYPSGGCYRKVVQQALGLQDGFRTDNIYMLCEDYLSGSRIGRRTDTRILIIADRKLATGEKVHDIIYFPVDLRYVLTVNSQWSVYNKFNHPKMEFDVKLNIKYRAFHIKSKIYYEIVIGPKWLVLQPNQNNFLEIDIFSQNYSIQDTNRPLVFQQFNGHWIQNKHSIQSLAGVDKARDTSLTDFKTFNEETSIDMIRILDNIYKNTRGKM